MAKTRVRKNPVYVELTDKSKAMLEAIQADWSDHSGEDNTQSGVIRGLIAQEFRRRRLRLEAIAKNLS